jgi:hypothetical protein
MHEWSPLNAGKDHFIDGFGNVGVICQDDDMRNVFQD